MTAFERLRFRIQYIDSSKEFNIFETDTFISFTVSLEILVPKNGAVTQITET
jgi:hypothetical protein